jgi:hypothetical protein
MTRRHDPTTSTGRRNWAAFTDDGTPIVATLPAAARSLNLDVDQLAALVHRARLAPWGEHANGLPVYRWRLLCELAATIGRTPVRR